MKPVRPMDRGAEVGWSRVCQAAWAGLSVLAQVGLAAALLVAKDLCQTRRRTERILAFSTTDLACDGCNRIALVVHDRLGIPRACPE